MPSLPDTWEVKDLARNWLPLELLNISVFIHEEASESLDHNAGCVAVWEGRKINFHTKPVNFWLEPDLRVSRYSHVGNTFCKNFFFFSPSQAGQVQSLPPTGTWARREGECSSCFSSWPHLCRWACPELQLVWLFQKWKPRHLTRYQGMFSWTLWLQTVRSAVIGSKLTTSV